MLLVMTRLFGQQVHPRDLLTQSPWGETPLLHAPHLLLQNQSKPRAPHKEGFNPRSISQKAQMQERSNSSCLDLRSSVSSTGQHPRPLPAPGIPLASGLWRSTLLLENVRNHQFFMKLHHALGKELVETFDLLELGRDPPALLVEHYYDSLAAFDRI